MFLDNIYPIQFIPDILNVLFFFSILIFLSITWKIKKKHFTILSISLFSPFLFYYFLPWTFLPDQSKYSDLVYNFRNFVYDKDISTLLSRTNFSSLLLALFPIPFVTSIISVALINKGILFAIVLFFLKKKKYYFIINILLLLPSMMVISSVALRDMLVIALGILFFYFSIEKKKYFISFFFGVSLLFTKSYFGILCISISIAYYIFFVRFNFNKLNNISIIILNLSIIFYFILLIFFHNQIIDFRQGFYLEELNFSEIVIMTEHVQLFTILSSFTNFLFSPLSTNQLTLFNILIFIENIFIIYLVILFLRLIYKENQFKAVLWLLIWLISFGLFGFVVFNAGTIWRYKLILQVVYLCAMYFSLKNNKQINLL